MVAQPLRYHSASPTLLWSSSAGLGGISHKVLWTLRHNEVMYYGTGQRKGKSTFSKSQVLCIEKLQIYFTLFVFISYKNYLNFSTCKFTRLRDLPLFMFVGQPWALWSPSKQCSLALLIHSGWYVISSFVRWHFAEYPWWILTLLLVRCY